MTAPAPHPELLALATTVPEHMAAAAAAVSDLSGLPTPTEIDNVVILGMGAGRTAGRLVRALAAPTVAIPILVASAYRLPGCVGSRSLVLAISGSGNTDEVNHAAAAAAERGARLVVIASGGWLATLAADRGAAQVCIPPEIRPARAALGFIAGASAAVLDDVGLLPGARGWIDAAQAQLRRRRAELLGVDSLANRLASHVAGRHVVIQGDDAFGSIAAERWKAQLNQNAKQPAWSSAQPDASHNEAVAWDFSPTGGPWADAVVLLRHGFEDARVGQDIDRLAAYLSGKVAVHTVRGEGECPLAAAMDLVMIGDVVSLWVAARNGVDPSAIRFISETVKIGQTPPQRWKGGRDGEPDAAPGG